MSLVTPEEAVRAEQEARERAKARHPTARHLNPRDLQWLRAIGIGSGEASKTEKQR